MTAWFATAAPPLTRAAPAPLSSAARRAGRDGDQEVAALWCAGAPGCANCVLRDAGRRRWVARRAGRRGARPRRGADRGRWTRRYGAEGSCLAVLPPSSGEPFTPARAAAAHGAGRTVGLSLARCPRLPPGALRRPARRCSTARPTWPRSPPSWTTAWRRRWWRCGTPPAGPRGRAAPAALARAGPAASTRVPAGTARPARARALRRGCGPRSRSWPAGRGRPAR